MKLAALIALVLLVWPITAFLLALFIDYLLEDVLVPRFRRFGGGGPQMTPEEIAVHDRQIEFMRDQRAGEWVDEAHVGDHGPMRTETFTFTIPPLDGVDLRGRRLIVIGKDGRPIKPD